jgi:large subunit ribosomal protein L9
MQVILMEKVANLGNLGDVVKVKDGFARNFLIPQGKAKRATPENIKHFEGRRAELEKAQNEVLAKAQEKAAKLEGLKLSITQKAGVDGRLFGTVTNYDIVEALEKQGHPRAHAAGPAQAGRRVPDRGRAPHRRNRHRYGGRHRRAVAVLSVSRAKEPQRCGSFFALSISSRHRGRA